jgi:hypothetical protein
MRIGLALILLIIISFESFASSQSTPQSSVLRMFWHPMMKGERLEYCNEDLSKCGQAIASCYCKKMLTNNKAIILHYWFYPRIRSPLMMTSRPT